MRRSFAIFSSFAFAFTLIAAPGCAMEDPGEAAAIEIPLVQSAAGGGVYRLRDATFEITGPDMVVQTVDGDVDASSVSLEVNPGTYSTRLLPGWTLEFTADGTTFQPLEAVIGSQNPQVLHVFPEAIQQVAFRFYVRDAQGAITITFGVVPDPHRLFGTMSFSTATGVLAQYAGRSVDFINYYDPAQQAVATEADGSKVRRYAARGIGVEFFGDPIGIFSAVIAPQAAGGNLDMVIRVRPDGSQELSGVVTTFTGSPISFGPATVAVAVDADGFPVDAAFAVSAPFTLIGPQSTAAGTTTLRHAVD